jgi:hypothetical protein
MAFVFWNCKDDPNNTGMDLLPGSDLKNVELSVEKESISAFTKKDVLIKTDEPNYNVFGTFNDPVFGKTSASMAFHARLPYYPDLADSLNLDSLVLYLLYKEFYGDTVTMQRLKVYELMEEIFIDTVSNSGAGAGDYNYYQDVDLKALASATPVGELDFLPKFELDSTETDTIIQELAIRLDQSLAEKLFYADSVDMINNDDYFLKFFKGLYVEAQDLSEGGAMLRISTLSGGSNLTLFYNYYDAVNDTVKRDSLIYRINSSSARISSYAHDYSTTDFASRLEDETTQDSLIYLQTLGGLRAKVIVPSLDNWKDSSNFVINKAQLIFHVDTVQSDYHKYKLPNQIVLRAIDENKPEEEGYFPSDIGVSESLYGGFYNSSDATYRFNITHHLQDIIDLSNEINNSGFYLSTAFQNEDTRRVVLKGATSHVGIRLEVTYTKLN